jgi:hypothetical protein
MTPETPLLRATDLVFPVMGVDVEADGSKKFREACGTAFTIGGGAYLTAGHVWKQASGFALQGLGLGVMRAENDEHITIRRVTHAEMFDAVDLAVLELDVSSLGKTFPWSTESVALLDRVNTFGYPYGFDVESETLTVRAFQGEIVGGRTLRRLSGRPMVHELSFQCPRGLSGAPLIRHEPKSQIVAVVLGNEITEMTVFTERETLAAGGQETVLIKTEALHLGIAIRASEVLPLHSSLLGCTIGAWLQCHGIPLTE